MITAEDGNGAYPGLPVAAVHVDRDLQVLAHGPQPVVIRVVKRLDPVDVGRDVREQDAPAQAVLLDPPHVLDRVVDVVEEDLADARPAARSAAAEILQPAVVRLDARAPALVLLR